MGPKAGKSTAVVNRANQQSRMSELLFWTLAAFFSELPTATNRVYFQPSSFLSGHVKLF